jgi:PAS domain S-box-containing protein
VIFAGITDHIIFIAQESTENLQSVFMNLQDKTLIAILLSIIAIIVVITVFVSGSLLANYRDLEHDYVAKDLHQALNKFTDEETTLSALVTDWAPWDDTYDFVNGNQPEYIAANLVPDTYNNLQLNLVIITNRQGDIVYMGAFDLQNKTMVAVPDAVLRQLDKRNPLMNMSSSRSSTTGILAIPGHPMLVASRPIVHTDFSGIPQGVVIMGRELNEAEIQRLAMLTQPSLKLTPIDDPGFTQEFVSSFQPGTQAVPEVIRIENSSYIGGYALIPDIFGRDAFILEINEPRDIYQQGISTTLYFIFILLACGVFLGLLIILLLHKFILSRMGYLNHQVHNLGMEHDLTRRVDIIGDDEFSGLAVEINRMLAEIERTHTELMRSKDRFRVLAELLPQIVFEMDTEGRITFLNRAGLSVGQIPVTDVSRGVNARDFFLPEEFATMQLNLQRLSAGEQSVEAMYTFVRSDGSTFQGNTYSSPIISDGTIVGFRGIIVDVTEQKKMENELADSREYLNQIFSSVNIGILVITADMHTIIDVNPAAAKIIGALKSDIIGKCCHHVVCPAEEGHCPITDENTVCENTERFLITTDGRQVPIIKHVVRIKLHGRDCLLETFIDNTDRKQMEDTLRQNQDMLSGILRASPVGVFRLDKTGKMLFINEMWTMITGYTLDQLTGKYWERILHPDDCERVLNEIKQAQRERRMIMVESRFIRPDGTLFWVYEQATLLVDPDGNLNGWVGTITDITERRRVEDELAESEEKYRALAENTADLLYSINLEGVMTYVSPSVNRYGYLVEEVISQPLTRFIHPQDRNAVMENLAEEVKAGQLKPSRFRIIDTWGYVHWIEENSTLRVNAFGEVIGLHGVLRDITERHQQDEAIRLANKKLNLLNNITRHDILNTITGLFGCVDMAQATKDPKELADLLDQIKELVRVVQRQIAFTREYQSVGVNAPAWQNLRDIINKAIVNFSHSGLTFRLDIANTEIYADPLLEKVFYNLVDNAIRYGGESLTTIKFYYLISDKGLSLICEDDGVGVPGDQKETIFERGVGKNTGMGLFLTREILLITDITIEENGNPGHGARFEIIIPNGAFRFVREKKEK